MVFSVIWSVFGWYQFSWIYWKSTIYRNFTWISAKWSIFRWSQRGPYIRNRVYLFLRANEINCKKERARSVTKVHNSRTLPCPSSSVSGWPWWPRWTPRSAPPSSWPSTPPANTRVLIDLSHKQNIHNNAHIFNCSNSLRHLHTSLSLQELVVYVFVILA